MAEFIFCKTKGGKISSNKLYLLTERKHLKINLRLAENPEELNMLAKRIKEVLK